MVKSGEKWDVMEHRKSGAPFVIGAFRTYVTGHYEHTIDEKGRITVPSKFRDELVDSVVITMGFDGNLLAFPHDLFVLLAENSAEQPDGFEQSYSAQAPLFRI